MPFMTEIDFINLVESKNISGLAEALSTPKVDYPNISKSLFVDMFNLGHEHQDADIVIGLLKNYPLIVDRIIEQGEYPPVCHQLSLYQEASSKEPNPSVLRALIDTMPVVPKALTYLIRIHSTNMDAYTAILETKVLPERDLRTEVNEILFEFPETLLDPLFKTQNQALCFETLDNFIVKMLPYLEGTEDKEGASLLENLEKRRGEWRVAVGMQSRSERIRLLNQSRQKLRRPKLG